MTASEWMKLLSDEKAFICINRDTFEPFLRLNGKDYEMNEEVSDYLYMMAYPYYG